MHMRVGMPLYEALHDSHSHLHPISPYLPGKKGAHVDSKVDVEDGEAAQRRVTRLVLCGTHPSIDWDAIEEVARALGRSPSTTFHPTVGFGVHPWFVPGPSLQLPHLNTNCHSGFSPSSAPAPAGGADDESSRGFVESPFIADTVARKPINDNLSLSDILRDLEARLKANPRAIVGEIGLDKLRGPSDTIQAQALREQLRLAAVYKRPVSVHCVRHYGLLLQVLQELTAEHTPPAIVIHAFTGSVEVAKSLLALRNKKLTQLATPAQCNEASLTTNADETDIEGELHKATSDTAAKRYEADPRKRTKRGGVSADVVRAKDRIFFGVGKSTSFTVKNFVTQTLPFLLEARRLLLETDAYYSAFAWRNSDGGDSEPNLFKVGRHHETGDGDSDPFLLIDPQEHVGELADLMDKIHIAAAQSREYVEKVAASGTTVEVLIGEVLQETYNTVFSAFSASPATKAKEEKN